MPTLVWSTDGTWLATVGSDGRQLAAGTSDGRARTFDLRPLSLLANGPAPSARAARIEAALLRL